MINLPEECAISLFHANRDTTYGERLRQVVDEVEHIVLIVALAGAVGLLGWRPFRSLRRR